MKKGIFTLILLLLTSIVISQNLPTLKLRGKKNIEIPENLQTNEIAVVVKEYGGWSPYDEIFYYLFKNDGKITAYIKKEVKSYLRDSDKLKDTISKFELSIEQKKRLEENLTSKLTTHFLKYSQKSFKRNIKQKRKARPFECFITDALGYEMTFIQNGKANSYEHYAPKFYLTECGDKRINRVMLRKYVKLIEMWSLNNKK